MTRPPRKLHLPDTHAMGDGGSDGRLFAPSAGRNQQPILELLLQHAPRSGRALEIASGTGQHIRAFAEAMPGLVWQPTDLAPANLPGIRAWITGAGLENLRAPLLMDAAAPGWAARHGPYDLLLTVNLMHLISEPEMDAIVTESARALTDGGLWLIYGPFRRADGFASAGDAAFHDRLRAQDPAIGYKTMGTVCTLLASAGFTTTEVIEMPANNVALLARK